MHGRAGLQSALFHPGPDLICRWWATAVTMAISWLQGDDAAVRSHFTQLERIPKALEVTEYVSVMALWVGSVVGQCSHARGMSQDCLVGGSWELRAEGTPFPRVNQELMGPPRPPGTSESAEGMGSHVSDVPGPLSLR